MPYKSYLPSWSRLLNAYRCYVVLSLSVLIGTACTKDLTPDQPNDLSYNLVVDGNIENGKPPIVLLTRSTKVFGDLNVNTLGSFLVHGADVRVVTDAHDTIQLEEICLKTLPIADSLKRPLLAGLGIVVYDSASVPDVCAYTLPIGELTSYFGGGVCTHCGVEQHSYGLIIRHQGQVVTATTSIPEVLGVGGLTLRPKPNNDSLVNVVAKLVVPPGYGRFVRYWTKRNQEPYYTPFTGSVFDDKFFSGKTVELPLERGISASYGTTVNQETFGYFWRGDTVVIKWVNIDSHTYDFFLTLENDGGNSPFGAPIKVKSNVVGNKAIGIWAGYGAKYYTVVIPK
jgi:Domain of unknown function (DUF4249)